MSFRQTDERNISGELLMMKWNPRMDLMVMVLKSSEVSLHRLASWQKVWTLPAIVLTESDADQEVKRETIKVKDVEWRPDGKVLAIAYSKNIMKLKPGQQANGSCVALIDVENAEIINVIDIEGVVTSLCWQCKVKSNDTELNAPIYDLPPFIDFVSKLKPMPRSIANRTQAPTMNMRKLSEDNLKDLMCVSSIDSLNILAVGTDKSKTYLYALGLLLCGTIACENGVVTHIAISEDLASINIITHQDSESARDYAIHNFKIRHLSTKSEQFLLVSKIYSDIIALMRYTSETIVAIQETWEDILLEIDAKLSSYVSQGTEGEMNALLSDEFMELLVFGTQSASLEKFLQELTDKGLKKLGHSIECTYSNIQKLIVINLQLVTHHLVCHLNVLKGICLWDIEFGGVGLSISEVNKSMKAIGSMLLKSVELQQVIDTSVRNVKAFFRWLYTVMIRMNSDSTAPTQEAVKITQQDLQFVGEFIEENFYSTTSENGETSKQEQELEKNRPTHSNFTLERVGQYLKNEELSHKNTSMNNFKLNPWMQYLKERPFFPKMDPQGQDWFCLFPHNIEKSLIQEHVELESTIIATFDGVLRKFTENSCLRLKYDKCLMTNKNLKKSPKFRSISTNDEICTIASDASSSVAHLFVLRFSNVPKSVAQGSKVHFELELNDRVCELKVLDFDIYNQECLSVLLSNNESEPSSYIAQIPFCQISETSDIMPGNDCLLMNTCVDIKITLSATTSAYGFYYQQIDNFKSLSLAVSGPRKIACVATVRRVRIYETDVADDDEEIGDDSLIEQSTDDVNSLNRTIADNIE